MPELFILTKIKIKHGKDHLQYCTKSVQISSTKEMPQIYIYTASKTVFICLAHQEHLQEGEEGSPASANHQECWQNC